MNVVIWQEVVAELRAAGCVFAEDEARLLVEAAGTPDELAAMVERRVSGEPIEYVVGWAEFCGLRIVVEPGVFVPRRRTEYLTRQSATLVRERARVGRPPVVVDLCCGSGAIGAALLADPGRIELYAADVDPVAVNCARRNLGDRARVYLGDLYEPLPPTLRGQVDVLVVNAPYVPTDEISLLPAEARLYEPATALDGGPDGLDVLRRAAAEAPSWLAAGGHLLVETSAAQAPAIAAEFAGHGLTPRIASAADAAATVVVGTSVGTTVIGAAAPARPAHPPAGPRPRGTRRRR